MNVPDIAALGRWLHSWVQDSGAIHGFHNHSVWGGNPFRLGDMTCMHSTWASPLLPALAHALDRHHDARGHDLLRRLIRFQTMSFQEDGQFRHIGFQTGEFGKDGLIHNAITDLSLSLTALHGGTFLEGEDLEAIRAAVLRNLEACTRYGGGRATSGGVANQEYARIWAKLAFQAAFDDARWRNELARDLDTMIAEFHVSGMPDAECEATWRVTRVRNAVEPAEYYGLMLGALVMGWETYGERRFLDHARALARHVVRSAWTDAAGRTRLHRNWVLVEGRWQRVCQPMLVSGMGDTLEGIADCCRHEPDAELEDFVARCVATYAACQHPAGFFVPATGWHSEADIAPSSAWHAHDFRCLVRHAQVDAAFWDGFFAPHARTAVLLGDQCFWVERGPHWAITDYMWQDLYKLRGRKDREMFGRQFADWMRDAPHLPAEHQFPGIPEFVKTDDAVYLATGDPDGMDIVANLDPNVRLVIGG